MVRVWTDTRSLCPGDLFVALRGERFDAHTFLAEAASRGTAGVVVSSLEGVGRLGVPVYLVSDTLRALGALANFWRRAWAGAVLGVVGTNGKTSTKELLRAALGARLRVHATEANLNNLVGVPLTVLAVPEVADVAVVEIGTNAPGEVAASASVARPDIAVVTSIAEEHLEGLGDLAGVMREELAACLEVPVTIVPASQPEVVEAARKLAGRVVSAGLDHGDVRPAAWGMTESGGGWLTLDGTTVRPGLRGVHNLRNTMLALTAARECGIAVEDAARGLATIRMPPMRSHVEQMGAITLINDAYNANPASTRAALELLETLGSARQRVAVLGTMLELGQHTARLHDDVARDALARRLDLIVGVGEFAAAFARMGQTDERIVTSDTVESLWDRLQPRVASNAVVLLKGSRGMRLERLVPRISAWAERAVGGTSPAMNP